MQVTRILHSIGQGAFYTEKFICDNDQYNIVFDCGGSSNVIHHSVRNYCRKLPKGQDEKGIVDAVFISHFDRDHVNGLKTLFQNSKVLRIFLPLISYNHILSINPSFFTLLGDAFYQNLFESAIEDSPVPSDGTEIIRIRPGNDETNGEYIISKNQELRTNIKTIPSLSNTYITHAQLWKFKTFNYEFSIRSNQLQQILLSSNYTLKLSKIVSNFSKNYRKYRNAISNLYKLVQGTINANSMITYSGPIDNKISTHLISQVTPQLGLYFYNNINYQLDKSGCMYFGDYTASDSQMWAEYAKHFSKEIPLLQMQQVPHHGSARDFNSQLCNNPIFHFISAAVGNHYGHPGNQVIVDLNNNYSSWAWINQFTQPDFEFEYTIS